MEEFHTFIIIAPAGINGSLLCQSLIQQPAH
jgi:hypothetical protein